MTRHVCVVLEYSVCGEWVCVAGFGLPGGLCVAGVLCWLWLLVRALLGRGGSGGLRVLPGRGTQHTHTHMT